MKFTCSVPCLFGLEGLVSDELKRLKMENVRAENGRVLFDGGWTEIARANLCLRMGERVLIVLGEFPAPTFDALFEGTKALPWETIIPKTGTFPIRCRTVNSALHSMPDCQKIVKKAISVRLGQKYHIDWLPETGELYQIRVSILKDVASLAIDTTGSGLHKRGWRAQGNDAPLRETLAAAMVNLARYRGRDTFVDPFCGSGTICIEAALAATNRAPGLARDFSAKHWTTMTQSVWQEETEAAHAREFHGDYRIFGSDIDPKSVAIARSNAKKAGVADLIDFREADARTVALPEGGGLLVANPPYGQRLGEQRDAQRLYQELGRRMAKEEGWKQYLITSEPEFERYYGRRATKKRKLYNGMIQCNLYMYF
jgi:putative N6-adenine-specific DNA methylase